MTISKEAIIRQLWLNYFNCVLREKGIITREEHYKMARKIYTTSAK